MISISPGTMNFLVPRNFRWQGEFAGASLEGARGEYSPDNDVAHEEREKAE